MRGLIASVGLTGPAAAGAHLGAVWGAEQVVLPATGASPPAWEWGRTEIGIDLFHHVVYAAVTSIAFACLDRY